MAEQFSKLGNVYFLFLAILQLVPAVTITNGAPTILFPLILIIIVTAIKDIFEDRQRHQSDTKENTQTARIYDKPQAQDLGNMGTTPWQSLRVGNIVRVNK